MQRLLQDLSKWETPAGDFCLLALHLCWSAMLCMLISPALVFVTDVMLSAPADTFIPMGVAAHKVTTCLSLFRSCLAALPCVAQRELSSEACGS